MNAERKVGLNTPEATVLKLLGRVAPVGGWCLDLEHDRFTVVLEPVRPIIGGERELETLVRRPSEVLDASSASAWSDALARARKAGQAWDLVLGTPSPSGGRRWIHALGETESRKGVVVRLVGVVQDITLSIAVEEELLHRHKLHLIAEVSPGLTELRDLLVAIRQCQGAAAAALPEWHPAQRDLAGLADALTQGRRIAEEILAMARPAGWRPVALDLGEVIEGIYPALQRALGERIVVDLIHATRLAPVLADQSQLEQAILGMALSARDSMPRGGAVTLMTQDVVSSVPLATLTGVRPPGAYVELQVHDTGPGIDEASRARLFRPNHEGSDGLGLLRCLRIVRQYGGVMDVDSVPGLGTVVRLWLPAVIGAAAPPADEPA